MSAWSHTVQLPSPLRDASTAAFLSATPADALQQTSWQAGYNQGRMDGEKALGQQLVAQRNELSEMLHGILASLRQAVPQVVRDTENMVVALALGVAQKLVADLPISVPMIEAAVRDALTHVESSAEVSVRLHPLDLEMLRHASSSLLAAAESSNTHRFNASEEVTRGGCMVETRFGTVDARRETKLELIKQTLPG